MSLGVEVTQRICYTWVMTPTNTSNDSLLQMPTGREVYDGLMSKINPELLTDNLPHLDEKYVDETPEQRKARYAKYQQDFAAYDEAYATWIAEVEALADKMCKEALETAEAESRTQEEAVLQDVESQMTA